MIYCRYGINKPCSSNNRELKFFAGMREEGPTILTFILRKLGTAERYDDWCMVSKVSELEMRLP